MSLSGPEALRSLEEALRDIRREEDELARRLAKSAEIVTKIREGESELLRQLAQVRLGPETQNELTGRLLQAEERAREMLKQHAGDVSAAEAALTELDAKIAAVSQQRTAIVAEEERQQAALKAIADRVAADYTRNPAYIEKRKAAEEATRIATEALRKTEQAEADREQKGKPYRDDPLFMYLWERGFGTKGYRANNLILWLDGLVAGLVGYRDARPNFAMLNELPLRLREHAERQQAEADAAQQAMLALETEAIDAAGGRPIREALAAAQAKLSALDEETVKLEDARDDAALRQRELAQGSDPAFSGAVQTLAQALGQLDIQTLISEARATRTEQDDTIVKQIDDARSRAAEEENETRDQKARLKTLESRRRELEDIQYEFKKSGFDNPRSSFGKDELVGDLLTDFLRGGLSAGSYWDQWRRSQRWQGGIRYDDDARRQRRDDDDDDFHWPDSSFGGGSRRNSGFGGSWGQLPGMGRSGRTSSGGGGFSRPRPSSGGFSGGGGFRTGGGFKAGGGFKTGGGF